MRIVAILAAFAALVGCAELIGIREIGDGAAPDAASDVTTNDGPTTACTTAVVTTPASMPIAVAAQAGSLYVIGTSGITRCSAPPCTDPPLIVSGQSSSFVQGTVGSSSVLYSLQQISGQGVHQAALDGTGDVLLHATPTAVDVAIGGAQRAFWLDDATGDVHCIGCNGVGVDTPWITGLSASAIIADTTEVYAAATAGSSSWAVYSCGASACANAPPLVVGNLGIAPDKTMLGSDDAFVYVARIDVVDLIRSNGTTQTTVMSGVSVAALAVDAKAGEVVYATSDAQIGIVKSDGSSPPKVLAQCAQPALSVAFDATHVYALEATGAGSVVVSFPR